MLSHGKCSHAGSALKQSERACSSWEALMRVATRQDAAVKPVSTSRSGRGTKYLHKEPVTAPGSDVPLLSNNSQEHRRTPRGPARLQQVLLNNTHTAVWPLQAADSQAHSRKFFGSRSSSSSCLRRCKSSEVRSRSATCPTSVREASAKQRAYCSQLSGLYQKYLADNALYLGCWKHTFQVPGLHQQQAPGPSGTGIVLPMCPSTWPRTPHRAA